MTPAKLLLMPTDLKTLRRKFTRRDSAVAPLWRHTLLLARRDPVFFAPYTVLAALVTGQGGDRELARQAFMRFVELQGEGLISNDAQFHTHVVAAQLARWAIFYDWIADTGILSPAEDQAFRDYLLDYALLFPWEHAASRARQFDNQLMSNAFGAAVVGYLLGVKRGSSAAARRIYRTGLDALRDLLHRLPAGGYSPEGSAYHEGVVLPLTLLGALFVEETTGEKTPDLRRLLETSCRMIGPAGLLPAWDAYGFQPASVKSGLAYLARLSGDARPLDIMQACSMWYRTTLPAWELDDRLWALVFWPDNPDAAAPATFPPWLQPEIAGALQDATSRVRLFQYWDECGGVPSSGRSKVNPNSITLEAFGSPVLLDGHGHPGREIIPLPEDKTLAYVTPRTVESVQEYIFSAWGGRPSVPEALAIALDGSVGMANSLVFDGDYWYVPKAPRSGVGEALHAVGPLQVLRSECAAYYQDRYDVSAVTRTSMLIDGQYVLVCDRVQAASPHALTWQAYVRQDAQLTAGRVACDTPELVHCDILPLQPGQLDLRPVTGYPRLGDGRSALLRHTVSPAAETRLDVALVPQPGAACLAKLLPQLATAFLRDPGKHGQTRRFLDAFELEPVPGRRYWLRVPASGTTISAKINATVCLPRLHQEKGHWPGSAEALPHIIDITAALQPGRNSLVLSVPCFHGESVLGPVLLMEERLPAAVTVEPTAAGSFRLQVGDRETVLLMEHRGGLTDWAGGRTDARYAVRTADATWAVAEATTLTVPGSLVFGSDAPCDLAWSESQTAVTRWVSGCGLSLVWPGAELRITTGGCLEIVYVGSGPYRLVMDLDAPQLVVVNGTALGVRQGRGTVLELPAQAPMAAARDVLPATVAEVFELAQGAARAVEPVVLRLLTAADWRLQEAAADVAGNLRLTASVPVLLALFAAGEAELPYPPLKTWWRASKMLRARNWIEGDDPTVPRPLGIKRWRLQRAVVTALGKIGDPRAVAALEAAMLRCTDFFPVTSQLPLALARIGAPSSAALLERFTNHAEANTRLHARLALALLKGEITRAQFENRAGMV